MVIAPPIRFSVVDFSENRGNHVKVSTFLGLLLAHLGFLGRPVDLLLQRSGTQPVRPFSPHVRRYAHVHISTYQPYILIFYVFIYTPTHTHTHIYTYSKLQKLWHKTYQHITYQDQCISTLFSLQRSVKICYVFSGTFFGQSNPLSIG